jgi:hypothetical protein
MNSTRQEDAGMSAGNGFGVIAMLVLGVISITIFALYVYSIIWSYGDAEQRGKSGCLVALLVALLSWPLGLLVWVVLRPDRGE